MDPIKEAELKKLNAEIAKIEEETLQLKNEKSKPFYKRLGFFDFIIKTSFVGFFITFIVYPSFEIKTIKNTLENEKKELNNYRLSRQLEIQDTILKRKNRSLDSSLRVLNIREIANLTYFNKIQELNKKLGALNFSNTNCNEIKQTLQEEINYLINNTPQNYLSSNNQSLENNIDIICNYFDINTDTIIEINLKASKYKILNGTFERLNYSIYKVSSESPKYYSNILLNTNIRQDSTLILSPGKYRFYINDLINIKYFSKNNPRSTKPVIKIYFTIYSRLYRIF